MAWLDDPQKLQQFIAGRQMDQQAATQQAQVPQQMPTSDPIMGSSGLSQLPMLMQAAQQGGGGGGGGPAPQGTGPLNLETEHGVTGNARAMSMLDRVAQQYPHLWGNVESDYRTRAEQAALYAKYKAGNGNLAAPPGHSMHEQGLAFDINAGWIDSRPGLRQLLDRLGGFPVGGEPWHWQPQFTL